MRRAMRGVASRGAFIASALIFAYFFLGAIALGRLLTDNWFAILMILVIALSVAVPFIDKAFGDKLPFLRLLPTPSANAKIRRILSAGSSNSNYDPLRASTKKEVIIGASFFVAPFLILMAIGAILSLFRPISDTYFNVAFATLYGAAILPGFFGTAFRLRKKFDLKNTLAAIIIFAPINALLIITIFLLNIALDGDGFRVSKDLLPFLSAVSLFITVMFTALIYLRKNDAAPAPAFTTHPIYPAAEIGLCAASLATLAVLFLLAS